MNRVWRESPAKGSELLLLLAIADFADDDGVAWPGVETLAKKARLSKRQTQYNIRSLVDAGLLTVEENAGPKGTHRYRVNMAHAGDAQIAPVQNVHRAKSARGGAKNDTKGVQPIAPEPSVEPSKNHQGKKRPTQVPDEFPITDALKAWGESNGFTVWQLESQVESFQDHYRAKGEARLDWVASFRTWMKKARTWNQLDAAPSPHRIGPPADDPRYFGTEGMRRWREEQAVRS